jgi:hypothetical protein
MKGGMVMQPKEPFCQSCAMPLEKPDLFGTNADGTKSAEYCTYCFQNGKFTEPTISLSQMIEKCVGIMTQRKIMLEHQAKELMSRTLPMLKRWKKN